MSDNNEIKLNVGCGHVQPEGWVNIDASNRARLASTLPWLDKLLVKTKILSPTEFNRNIRCIDMRKRLPFGDNTVSVVYSGETLEHVTYPEARSFLRECHRILKPGGVCRIRVPDCYVSWKKYIDEYEEHRAKPREEWGEWRPRNHYYMQGNYNNVCTERLWLGSMGHYHKWSYDEISLILDFEEAGFVEVERHLKFESRIPDIEAVETRQNLIVEGIKPAE
jgi:predicted SAM-dependent methyltransferase